jgi:flagella basal body P-ring formation protein FlgA
MTDAMRRSALACLLFIAGSGVAAASTDTQPLDELVAAAEREALRLAAVDADTGARAVAKPPDPRLRLPRCRGALTARSSAAAPRGARLSIAVGCPIPAWQVYVAVTLHAPTRVVVAARPLAARSTITGADITVQDRDLADLPAGFETDPAAVVGSTLLRPLAQGEPVERNQLQAPTLVARGQEVTLFWQTAGLRVSVRGEALAAAAAEDRVRVRNLSSGRDVEGIVRGQGLVEVLP